VATYDPDKHCGAQRYGQPPGVLCTQRKGHGTSHPGIGRCSRHGGSTPTHVAAAEAELARQACTTLGVPVAIDPAEALLDELRRSYGNVLFYEGLVSHLATHPTADRRPPPAGSTFDDLLAMYGGQGATIGDGAIYSPIYHASGQPTGEARAHVLVGLYNAERTHYAKVAASALSAGVAQRVIELAEQTARQVVEVLTDFAQRLGLDPTSPDVREAGRAALQLVSGGESP
jgi:hypothetical protein